MPIVVDIMTPERLVMQAEADSVTLPAADCELGVLKGHAPLLAQLKPGQVRLRRGDNIDYFVVSGGFAEVRNNRVAIFAETAETAGEIDAERAKQAVERARAALRQAGRGSGGMEAEAALLRALARLRVHDAVRRQARRH
jgi:F-type H+-transporting ATPase subunit epsilon